MSETPEYHEHDEFINRSHKLNEIRNWHVEPYPAYFRPTSTIEEIIDQYDEQEVGDFEQAEARQSNAVCIAGRLVLFRAMGKNAFGQLMQEGKKIQFLFNRDHSYIQGYKPENSNPKQPTSHIKFLEKKIDLGDYIGIKGYLFRTQKGELTVYIEELNLLCKSLLPLPDKHSGLLDKEIRYRKRWLDLISNTEVLQTFKLRSKIVKAVRNFLDEQNFMEVETPILQTIYGGANARPFKTELFALNNQKMFLRISLEISLKKLLVGGFERIYEIGKCFRNEGIDRTHNPEFSMLEVYAAYWDYTDMMQLVENLFEKLALLIYGETAIPVFDPHSNQETIIEMKAPWERLSMADSLNKYADIDVASQDDSALREMVKKYCDTDPLELQTASRGIMISWLFEELVEQHLIQPVHIIDHPIETTPLCKLHRDSDKREQKLVERFESFILGHEVCNAYSELNDPELQRKLLEQQDKRKQEGDEEANPLDEDFIEAICQGMPPAGGLGIGIDRLVMLLTHAQSIRDVLYFPLMKPKEV